MENNLQPQTQQHSSPVTTDSEFEKIKTYLEKIGNEIRDDCNPFKANSQNKFLENFAPRVFEEYQSKIEQDSMFMEMFLKFSEMLNLY